jgi:hypothetical protein
MVSWTRSSDGRQNKYLTEILEEKFFSKAVTWKNADEMME